MTPRPLYLFNLKAASVYMAFFGKYNTWTEMKKRFICCSKEHVFVKWKPFPLKNKCPTQGFVGKIVCKYIVQSTFYLG